jgi:hypothetical protein
MRLTKTNAEKYLEIKETRKPLSIVPYTMGTPDLPWEFRTTCYLRMAPWWVDS